MFPKVPAKINSRQKKFNQKDRFDLIFWFLAKYSELDNLKEKKSSDNFQICFCLSLSSI